MDLDTHLIPFTKIKSIWITDLNIKCKILKLLEDNISKSWMTLMMAMTIEIQH